MASNSITLSGHDTQLSAGSDERNVSSAMMRAQQEVQAAIIIAQKFPRNEDMAAAAIWKSCQRTTFAERAEYSFPRGKKQDNQGRWVENFVTGPSANMAREAVRCWGNIQVGTEIVRDTPEERQIRSFAWDMQTNTKRTSEASFRKLIQRKRGNNTEWVQPDERDLRELTNKHASIAERNCSLQLIPSDVIEEAIRVARETKNSEAIKDPEAAKRKLILGFAQLNVTVLMLEEFLEHPLGQCSPAELAELRSIWASINEGNSTWAEYTTGHVEPEAGKGPTPASAAGTAAAHTAGERLANKYARKPTAEAPQEEQQQQQAPPQQQAPIEAYSAEEATTDPTTASQPSAPPQAGQQTLGGSFDPFGSQTPSRRSVPRQH